MRERERVAVDEVRRDVGLVDLLLLGVGQQHHDDVGLAHRLGGREHPQARGFRLRLRLRTGAQADHDVDAGVLQVQRVRVTLGAVAEDRDQLVGDQAEIGVVLVIDGGGHRTDLLVQMRLGTAGPAPIVSPTAAGNGNQPRAVLTERSRVDSAGQLRQRDAARALQLDDAERLDQIAERVELLGLADDHDRHRLVADVDDLGLEDRRELGDLAAGLGRGLDDHEHQLALDSLGRRDLGDLDHGDQLVELLHDLFERRRLRVDHDRHAREPLVVGRADRERDDVERPAREQPRDARQHARLVLDGDGEDVMGTTTVIARPLRTRDRG